MNKLLACEIHDYFESACVLQYRLEIEFSSGESVIGLAKDIVLKEKKEFLILSTETGQVFVDLLLIKNVDVLTQNAKFKSIPIRT